MLADDCLGLSNRSRCVCVYAVKAIAAFPAAAHPVQLHLAIDAKPPPLLDGDLGHGCCPPPDPSKPHRTPYFKDADDLLFGRSNIPRIDEPAPGTRLPGASTGSLTFTDHGRGSGLLSVRGSPSAVTAVLYPAPRR
jgi:hypothetical protein